jgi:hypothetical protein
MAITAASAYSRNVLFFFSFLSDSFLSDFSKETSPDYDLSGMYSLGGGL